MIKLYSLVLVFLLISLSGNSQNNNAGPSGGVGGRDFYHSGLHSNRLSEIRIRSGNVIDAIKLVYTDASCNQRVESDWFGGPGGQEKVLRLECDEYITGVGGRYRNYVQWLYVKTNKNRTIEWGNTNSDGKIFSYTIADGHRLQGFWGRSGTAIDAIGIIFQKGN